MIISADWDFGMSLAAFRIGTSVARERSQRMAKLVQVNRPQINDSSVQQQRVEGHFRKHISFNLELDGLQQQRAMSLSTPVSKEQENEVMWAITRTGCGKIKRDLRNPGLWCDILVTGCGLYSHGALFFGYTQQDKCRFTCTHRFRLFQEHDSDLSFPPIARALFISQPNRAPLGWCGICWYQNECITMASAWTSSPRGSFTAPCWIHASMKWQNDLLQYLSEHIRCIG